MLTLTHDMSRARKRLAEVRATLRGDGARARPAYEAAGLSILADARTDFIVKARGDTGATGDKWPDISPITKILRPGPKVSSWSELIAEEAQIGRSTAAMFQSLTHGSPGNLFRLADTSVTVGTNVKHAVKFHEGGVTSQDGFSVTAEMYARARKRVAKPRKLTKKQRRAIAKGEDPGDSQADLRGFNREIFGVLFGMEATGARPTQPARPIFPEPRSHTPKEWIARAADKWWAVVQKLLGRI